MDEAGQVKRASKQQAVREFFYREEEGGTWREGWLGWVWLWGRLKGGQAGLMVGLLKGWLVGG